MRKTRDEKIHYQQADVVRNVKESSSGQKK